MILNNDEKVIEFLASVILFLLRMLEKNRTKDIYSTSVILDFFNRKNVQCLLQCIIFIKE